MVTIRPDSFENSPSFLLDQILKEGGGLYGVEGLDRELTVTNENLTVTSEKQTLNSPKNRLNFDSKESSFQRVNENYANLLFGYSARSTRSLVV